MQLDILDTNNLETHTYESRLKQCITFCKIFNLMKSHI